MGDVILFRGSPSPEVDQRLSPAQIEMLTRLREAERRVRFGDDGLTITGVALALVASDGTAWMTWAGISMPEELARAAADLSREIGVSPLRPPKS